MTVTQGPEIVTSATDCLSVDASCVASSLADSEVKSEKWLVGTVPVCVGAPFPWALGEQSVVDWGAVAPECPGAPPAATTSCRHQHPRCRLAGAEVSSQKDEPPEVCCQRLPSLPPGVLGRPAAGLRSSHRSLCPGLRP